MLLAYLRALLLHIARAGTFEPPFHVRRDSVRLSWDVESGVHLIPGCHINPTRKEMGLIQTPKYNRISWRG